MNQTFMKERRILPLILSMSLPMVISMAVNSLYNIVDSYFVAKISDDAMTALSLVFPIQNLVNAIAIGFGVGVNACIAFFLGAERKDAADHSATLGILLSGIHGVLLTLLCLIIMPFFLRLFTSDPVILDLALTYSNRVFLFSTAVNIGICLEKIFQAVGKMKVSMFSMICGCVANIILDPFMIFGYGPFPAMGISGAAYATGIGQCLTLIIYIVIMILRPIPVRAQLRYLHPDGTLIRRLYQVGVPATLNTALPSVQVSVLNQILTTFSAQYVLILGIYYKLQTFIYLTANGMVQGIRPLVGYNAGAGEPKRVEKIFTTSMLLIMGIMLVGTILSWLFPLQIFGLFAKDPAAIKIGGHALQIISLGFIVSGISVTCSGVLEGLGRGGSSLLISLSRYIIVMLPMAFLLSRFLKTDGVWYAFVVTEFLTAGLSLLIWKKTRSMLYSRERKENEDKVERKESL